MSSLLLFVVSVVCFNLCKPPVSYTGITAAIIFMYNIFYYIELRMKTIQGIIVIIKNNVV